MVVNNLYNVILSPVITEKAAKISENNQYVFKVSISSDKKNQGLFKYILDLVCF